jgi:hypothetical protein
MATITKSNWRVIYGWSPASGVRLGACEYKGVKVLEAASVPFVHVKYAGDSSGPFTDMLQSADTPPPPVEIREIMLGFDLRARYDFYGEDYQYEHVWRFHEDGQFATKIVIQGPGEEIHGRHTYHLPFRFDLDLSGAARDSLQRFVPVGAAGHWVDVPKEGRVLPSVGRWDWRVIDKATNRRCSIRASARDNAELWGFRYSAGESWASWGGALSAPPGAPGSVPAVYETGQSVQNADIVIWYLAHVPSGDLVTACGPWLRLGGF